MKPSSNKKSLSLTVGLCTCYGDISILDTVKSIRQSRGVGKFDFIIIADRVPLSEKIKKGLKKYNVKCIENKYETGQVQKQRQILALAKTDIIVLTQDDVLLDPYALRDVIKKFSQYPDVTMISIPYIPVHATNFFENILNVGTHIVNNTVKHWNNGENYLASIGRFMAFRASTVKKFRLPPVAVSDNYYYFENEKMGGKFGYVDTTAVYFKNPQNMKEHARKSSRFQHSQKEMEHYFNDLSQKYTIPRIALLRGFMKEFINNPFFTLCYILVFAYTRFHKLNSDKVLNPIWEVDLSTKKLR